MNYKESVHIYYVTLESIKTQPIIKSQVIPLLHCIQGKAMPSSNNFKFSLITKDRDDVTIDPDINHIRIQQSNYLICQFVLFAKLFARRRTIDIIHVRSYLPMTACMLFKLIFRKRLIFDMRGVFPEEMKLRGGAKSIFLLFKSLEKWFCYKSNLIVVVTKNFQKHICEEYPKIPESKVKMIPTFPNLTHNYGSEDYKDILNIKLEYFKDPKAKIFVYSGAFEKWQCIDSLFVLFSIIAKEVPNSRFAIFSHHKDRFVEYGKSIGFDMSLVYLEYVENRLLPLYLQQCDVGILLRENLLINRVAAPIKLMDYLSNNLLLLISSKIGDSTRLVEEYNLGIIVKDLSYNSMENAINELILNFAELEKGREQRISSALRKYSLEEIASKYVTIYEDLLKH